jgi:GntR family transcriptional regulator/MocR family aminotransferase
VVVDVYSQLVAEGWLRGRPGSGTRVAMAAPFEASPPPPAPHPAPCFDFRAGVPDVAGFPRTAWLRSTAAILHDAPASRLLYPADQGLMELREALAVYLGRVRGVLATPETIVVCAGVAQGLHLLAEELTSAGAAPLAIEDPAQRRERDLITATGLELLSVGVGDDGLDTDRLVQTDARAVLVTPAHQFPLGVVMGPDRRADLVVWASRRGGLVIEDDYDAEFRFDRHPVGALQGLAPEHTVYLGSVSKTLAPGLRLGWIVAPRPLAERLARRKQQDDLGSPALDQLTLAHFVESGSYDRHIRRMCQRYRERRNALLSALALHLPGAETSGVSAGIHVLVQLPEGVDEDRVVEAAECRSVRVEGLRQHCVSARRPPALVLGYASLTPSAIDEGVRQLAAAVGDTLVSAH